MRSLIITALITLLLSYYTAYSQEYSKEFGKVSSAEIDLIEYNSDKSAEAVVLFDLGKSRFTRTDHGFDVIFERCTRIKILKESGLKWATVEIPYYIGDENAEKIYDLTAYAYNFENLQLNKVEFDTKNYYDEKINNFWRVRKFALPNVKAGTIIEYKYSIQSPYKFNFRDWEFQWEIPVIYSEYKTSMIPWYEYTWMLQGAKKFDIYETHEDVMTSRNYGGNDPFGANAVHDMVYTFGMKNVPAFSDEEFISSKNDYILKIDFQLARFNSESGAKIDIITTWDALIKELLKSDECGKVMKAAERNASDLINVEQLKLKPANDRFNTVIDFVKDNFNWNSHAEYTATQSYKKLIETKQGNCAEINLLACGLLKAVNIETFPVILSTLNHGKIKVDYPFAQSFNYLIIAAKIDSTFILSDATASNCLNNRIPEKCMNGNGLLLNDKKVEWIVLEGTFPSTQAYYIRQKINSDKSITAEVQITANEYDALNFRNNFGDKEDEVILKLKEDYSFVIDSSVKILHPFDKTKPYILRYSLQTQPEIINDKIYISPFLKESLSENPLKQKERKYPIEMRYPKKKTYVTIIEIPEGFQVEYLPPAQEISNVLFSLNYEPQKLDNLIQISFEYYFKRAEYLSTDYNLIKYYFNEIYKKSNEKVVLKKL